MKKLNLTWAVAILVPLFIMGCHRRDGSPSQRLVDGPVAPINPIVDPTPTPVTPTPTPTPVVDPTPTPTPVPVPTYEMTFNFISLDDGSILANQGIQSHKAGDSITLSVNKDITIGGVAYSFIDWESDTLPKDVEGSKALSITFPMAASNYTVSAGYMKKIIPTHQLTISYDVPGSQPWHVPATDVRQVAENSAVTLTPPSVDGYVFSSWEGESIEFKDLSVASDGTVTFAMPSMSESIVAHYVVIPAAPVTPAPVPQTDNKETDWSNYPGYSN